MKLLGLLVTVATISSAPLAAQTTLLVGRILDSATSKPVTSGWVTVLGTALSAPLHEDGSFALSVPIRDITTAIRADGYKPRELQIRPSEDVLEIRLARDYFEQENDIVSGQATSVDRKHMSTNVARVSSDDIEKSAPHDMSQTLSGHVTGASVSPSASPGSAMLLRLRGMTTIMGNSQPLFIVDGITVSSVDAINPNDIEDIQILKGASAGSMYGSKASNGVVIIKTKRGGLPTKPKAR